MDENDRKECEKRILQELNLTEEYLLEGIVQLKNWLQKQPHLPNSEDDLMLKAFIIGSKSVERAKDKLDKYYTARTKLPEVFNDRDPLLIKWNQVEKVTPMPGLTPNGHSIMYIIVPHKKEDLDAFSLIETSRAFFSILDLKLRKDPMSSGQYIIMDCKNVSMELVLKYMSAFVSQAIDVYQHSVPVRMKGYICFNASTTAEVLTNKILKVFFSPKLRERIFVFSEDHTVLSKYVPKEMLPSDYGGKNLSLQDMFETTKKDLEKNRDWLLNEGSQTSNEAKRPLNENNIEHVQGTFRKLQID